MNLEMQARLFAKLLKNHFNDRLVSILLFGSVGRRTETPSSDVDILIVVKNLPPERYIRRTLLEPVLNAAEKKGLTAIFNCHIKTPDEAQKITVMYFDFPTDAKLLYDKNGFFAEIIKEVKKKIKASGAVRKKWGEFYYWDLKPGAHADETFEIL